MNVAIIGCGYIGQKRFSALGADDRLYGVFDTDRSRAEALASRADDVKIFESVEQAVHDAGVEVVVVSTTNDFLASTTELAARNGKHVIVEKPAGRNVAEVERAQNAALAGRVVVQVGFNHRFHAALLKAKELVDEGACGELMFVRGRYGHGGRLGYDREWRADPEKSGGGELVDQGCHLIDLSRWFLGEFTELSGYADTLYWDMPVDDNAFLLLGTKDRKLAWLHASCTEWKNMFSYEIYGRTGKLSIDGLGGSYGVERLSYYRMLPEMGPPETTIWEYPGRELSWEREFASFKAAIQQGHGPAVGLADAVAVLRIAQRVYETEHVGKVIGTASAGERGE